MDIMRKSACLVTNPITVYTKKNLHDGGSDLRLNNDPNLKLSSVGQ